MTTSWRRRLAAAAALVSPLLAGGALLGDERPRTSSTVKATAQGGAGTEPVAGSPPAVEPSLASRPARAATSAAAGKPQGELALAGLRAVSFGDAEATLEIDGRREVVRAGSRLGSDTVRSVAPGRIVLERPGPAATDGSAVVIVTFDEAGRGKERVFWAKDPARPAEVKRP